MGETRGTKIWGAFSGRLGWLLLLWALSAFRFRAFLDFGGAWLPVPLLGSKGGSWNSLWRQSRIKVVFVVLGDGHVVDRGCQKHTQRRQQSPKERPKGSQKGSKKGQQPN